MENKQEIQVQKTSISQFFKNLFYSYLITFILILLIQHLGHFSWVNCDPTLCYYSPLSDERFITDFPSVKQRDYNSALHYSGDHYNYLDKLKKVYIPSMFMQLAKIQFLLTLIITAFFYLIQYLRKRYNLKLV